jgi:hypothetical protein
LNLGRPTKRIVVNSDLKGLFKVGIGCRNNLPLQDASLGTAIVERALVAAGSNLLDLQPDLEVFINKLSVSTMEI